MSDERKENGQAIVIAGLLIGQTIESIRGELLAIGLNESDAAELLWRGMSAFSEHADEIAKHFPNPHKPDAVEAESVGTRTESYEPALGDYFEVPITPQDCFLCSDLLCPCPGSERLVPGETGFIYISPEVVEMRQDALSWK
jgi:hypothetical protein